MLGALRLDPAGAAYHFNARFTPNDKTGSLVDGSVDQRGQITVVSQTSSGPHRARSAWPAERGSRLRAVRSRSRISVRG